MNLLLTGCFKYSEEQLEKLSSIGYNIYFIQQEKEELPLDASDFDAIVCNGLFLSHDIDLFDRLKFIQLTSAGYDRVPVDKIKERGINLFNARGVYSVPMAEWVLFRVLEYYKQGCFFYQEQIKHRWNKHRGLREISGTKVAIVGAGSIGQEVAKRLKAFGAEIMGFDIHTNKIEGFDNIALTSTLRSCIGLFDIVVLTAPLLPSTQGMINKDMFRAMKNNAILINIARGGLIDEKAMCEVLSERKDLYVALDVFETEPLAESSQLWKMRNVAISPHNSFVSNGNNKRMFDVIYTNLRNFKEMK